MSLNAFDSGFIVLDPCVEYLSVDDLPKVVNVSFDRNMFSYQICQTVQRNKGATMTQDSSDLPVEVAQTSIDLPVLVAQNNSDLPMVVAQNNSDLPVVVAQNNSHLPVVVAQNNSDLPVVVAQNNSDLPVVVAQNNSDLPMVVAQTNSDLPKATAQNNSDLPMVLRQHNDKVPVNMNVHPDQDMNESQVWTIYYAKELQGLVIADQEIDSHYYDIHTAWLNTFFNYNHAILILECYMMAIIKQTNFIYLFDSHARDISGMPDPNGTAVIIRFTNILELEQYLYCLSSELHTNSYEIVPIKINKCTFCHDIQKKIDFRNQMILKKGNGQKKLTVRNKLDFKKIF